MTSEYFKSLLTAYHAGTLSPTEKQELIEILHTARAGQDPFTMLQTLFPETLADPDLDNLAAPETLGLIYQQILQQSNIETEESTPYPINTPHEIRRRIWPRLAAAASILLVIAGIAIYFFLFRQNHNQPAIAALPADIKAPAANRATIVLGNGQPINLDSAANGQLALQGNARLVKIADGQLAYRADQAADRTAKNTILYNTLINPRGSRVINIMLSDGTKVWLNTASTLKYPASFSTADRNVEMTGEAYFEVAKDKSRPFRVRSHGMNVDVLGTHFNINAYDDESALNTTLLEGSIRVGGSSGPSLVLKPGQQASIPGGGAAPKLISDANLEQTMAWRNGAFAFSHADLPAVMRQLSRWYDVAVEYDGPVQKRTFSGEIGNNLTLSQVLDGLSTTRINYKIVNNNKIIILSENK